MTRLDWYADVAKLATRGLPAAEIARGLDLPEAEVRAVARDVHHDGERDLYVTDCLNRAKADPHKFDAACYLYARGVPWRDALEHVGYSRRSKHREAPRAAREAYQHTQLRLARAGVLP